MVSKSSEPRTALHSLEPTFFLRAASVSPQIDYFPFPYLDCVRLTLEC